MVTLRFITTATALVGLAALTGLGACDVQDPESTDDGAPDVVQPDAADTGQDVGPVYQACDRDNGDADCPAGWSCETETEVCVACLLDETRCGDSGVRERCEEPVVEAGSVVSGGLFEADPCAAGSVCVPGAVNGKTTCEAPICEPFAFACDDTDLKVQRQCNGSGTAWAKVNNCGSGRACREGQCRLIRHNVLLIFDTSASMNDYVGGQDCAGPDVPCLYDFPACDADDAPLTKIALAKQVFAENIQATVDDHVQFALQRFPQRELLTGPGSCHNGWYASDPTAVMSGDDGSWSTAPGGWFDKGLQEVVVAKFPDSASDTNTEELLDWMDFKELISSTNTVCTSGADCTSGLCGDTVNGKRCFTHANHELRGTGSTPLGKSLFYAGEYFRRFVLLDGKPCQSASDCRSAGYVCNDQGVCEDEHEHCRKNFVILFTDGVQTPPRLLDDFFHPVNQAKRLAYGLGCSVDADCRGGATCVQQRCTPPDRDLDTVTTFTAGVGEEALSTEGGHPVSITVSVVNLNATTASSNEDIALAGGGELLDVQTDDPEDFKQRLQELMRVAWKCQAQ